MVVVLCVGGEEGEGGGGEGREGRRGKVVVVVVVVQSIEARVCQSRRADGMHLMKGRQTPRSQTPGHLRHPRTDMEKQMPLSAPENVLSQTANCCSLRDTSWLRSRCTHLHVNLQRECRTDSENARESLPASSSPQQRPAVPCCLRPLPSEAVSSTE